METPNILENKFYGFNKTRSSSKEKYYYNGNILFNNFLINILHFRMPNNSKNLNGTVTKIDKSIGFQWRQIEALAHY